MWMKSFVSRGYQSSTPSGPPVGQELLDPDGSGSWRLFKEMQSPQITRNINP